LIVGRIIGIVLLMAALALLGYEINNAVSAGGYRIISGGEIWRRLHANSLVGFGALVEKQIAPWLWSGVSVPILRLPSWIVPGVPGLILIVLFWPRGKRRHRKKGRFA